MYELRGLFYINLVQQKIHRRWVNNIEVNKKHDVEDEDFLFMILELYTSVVSFF